MPSRDRLARVTLAALAASPVSCAGDAAALATGDLRPGFLVRLTDLLNRRAAERHRLTGSSTPLRAWRRANGSGF